MKTLIAACALALVLALPAGGAEAGSDTIPDTPNVAKELRCMALNLYFEARGEPDTGMLAVGHVVMNRLADPRFPDTVCGVVKQGGERVRHRCQFSWWCDGKSDVPQELDEWQRARTLARSVYWGRGVDPTQGATFYHADYVAPSWRHAFDRGPKIGQHIFYIAQLPRRDQLAQR